MSPFFKRKLPSSCVSLAILSHCNKMIIGTTTEAKFVMLAPVSVIFWQTFEGGKDDNIQFHITSIKLEFTLQCVKVLFCQHIFWEVAENRSKVGFQTPVAYHLRSVYYGRTTRSSNQSISHTEAALLVSSFPLTSLRSTLCFFIWSHLTPPFTICSPNLILHLSLLLHLFSSPLTDAILLITST